MKRTKFCYFLIRVHGSKMGEECFFLRLLYRLVSKSQTLTSCEFINCWIPLVMRQSIAGDLNALWYCHRVRFVPVQGHFLVIITDWKLKKIRLINKVGYNHGYFLKPDNRKYQLHSRKKVEDHLPSNNPSRVTPLNRVNDTVKPRLTDLTATPPWMLSLRYYDHFFWPRGKTIIRSLVKKPHR